MKTPDNAFSAEIHSRKNNLSLKIVNRGLKKVRCSFRVFKEVNFVHEFAPSDHKALCDNWVMKLSLAFDFF